MRKELIRTLEQTKALIKDPNVWVNEMPTDGNTHCVLSALDKVGGDMFYLCNDILDKTATMMGYSCCIDLNDNSSHSTVMTLLDLAIQFVQDNTIPIL